MRLQRRIAVWYRKALSLGAVVVLTLGVFGGAFAISRGWFGMGLNPSVRYGVAVFLSIVGIVVAIVYLDHISDRPI